MKEGVNVTMKMHPHKKHKSGKKGLALLPVVLIAGGLLMHHNRKKKQERQD